MARPTWLWNVAVLVLAAMAAPPVVLGQADHDHTLTKRQTDESRVPIPLTQGQTAPDALLTVRDSPSPDGSSQPQGGGTGGNGYFRTYVPQFGTGGSDGGVASRRASRTQDQDRGGAYPGGVPTPTGSQPDPSGPLYSRVAQPVYDSQGRQVYNGQGQPVYSSQGSTAYNGQGSTAYNGQGSTAYNGQGQVQYRGQPFYNIRQGQSVPSQTYTPGNSGQTYYTGGSYQTNGQYPVYGQVPLYNAPQTVYTPAVQPGQNLYGYQPPYVNRQPTGYIPYNPYVDSTVPNDGCPETGVRLRINGMYCPQAVQTLGASICYRHAFSSRECCLACSRLKDASKVGCEYGDHSVQCRQIQPSDCYDVRNRQSCCDTCERRKTNPDSPGCEYGDMTPRCEQVRQNPGLCYFAENQRLCCQSCERLRDAQNLDCPWGNQNSQLCEPYDNFGNERLNCYAEPIRRLCCDTCKRLKERMPDDVPSDCEYGNRPVLFNTPSFGSLNCSSFFRYFDRSQCLYNAAVSSNCCFTCYRMRKAGFLEGIDPRQRLQTAALTSQPHSYGRRTYSQVGTGRQYTDQDRRRSRSAQSYRQG